MNIKRLIKDTYVIQKKVEEFNSMIKQNMEKIQQHFDKNSLKALDVDAETENDVALTAKKSERVMIDYYPDKLKETLDANIYNEVVTKQYTISDMQGLVALLKKSGVSPAEFKKFIIVDESVNKAAIRQLYDTGDIKKGDLKGCYSAKVVKSIKIAPVKNA